MEKYLSIKEIENNEKIAIQKGMTVEKMMDSAGQQVADFLHKNLNFDKVVFIAGTGNNGGDTLSVAFHLFNLKHTNLQVFVDGNEKDLREGPTTFLRLIKDTKEIPVKFISDAADLESAKQEISTADMIIAGIFGTGFHGELLPLTADLIDVINDSAAKKISIDIPSGMNGDTGEFKKVVKSDFTFTMMAMKKAFNNATSAAVCGKIILLNIIG
jgi:NAD(P)H-hydrate epimerase